MNDHDIHIFFKYALTWPISVFTEVIIMDTPWPYGLRTTASSISLPHFLRMGEYFTRLKLAATNSIDNISWQKPVATISKANISWQKQAANKREYSIELYKWICMAFGICLIDLKIINKHKTITNLDQSSKFIYSRSQTNHVKQHLTWYMRYIKW